MGSTGAVTIRTVSANSWYKWGADAYESSQTLEKYLTPELRQALLDYATVFYAGANTTTEQFEKQKNQFDQQNGISKFIESSKSPKMTDTTLYRGLILTPDEMKDLKVGNTIKSPSFTSWSIREMTAHMYTEGDPYTGATIGGRKGTPVIFVEEHTNDSVPLPYTIPHYETLRSKNVSYEITKVVPIDQYTKPIGRDEGSSDYYTKPVVYVYVKSKKK